MTKFALSTAVGAALLLSLTWITPATADEETAVDAVAAVAPTDVASTVDAPLTTTGESTATVDSVEVGIASSAAEGVSVSTGEGAMTIGLPFASTALDGISTEPGTMTFDNRNATSSVVLVHDSGSMQVATVIDDANAPTRYDYPIDLPEASSLVLQNGGAAVVDDATGEVWAALQHLGPRTRPARMYRPTMS